LEWHGVLRAWRLPPDYVAGTAAVARPNRDHRLHYLDYTGPIAGGRGTVTAWDRGGLAYLHIGDTAWTLDFAGERMHGVYTLTRDGEAWRLRPAAGEPATRAAENATSRC